MRDIGSERAILPNGDGLHVEREPYLKIKAFCSENGTQN